MTKGVLSKDSLFELLNNPSSTSSMATSSSSATSKKAKVQLKSKQPQPQPQSHRLSLAGGIGALKGASSSSADAHLSLGPSAFAPHASAASSLSLSRSKDSLFSNPAHAHAHSSPMATAAGKNFEARPNKGKIEFTLNKHIPYGRGGSAAAAACSITLPPGQQTHGYRHGYGKLVEMGDVMDDRIEKMMPLLKELIIETDQLSSDEQSDFEFVSPAIPFTEKIYCIGRILCDSPEEGAKLNESSMLLETCRSIDNVSAKVLLSFKDLVNNSQSSSTSSTLRIFPGQIIAIRGKNPSGRLLEVDQVYYPPAAEMSSTSVADILEFYKNKENTTANSTDSKMAVDEIIGNVDDKIDSSPTATTLDLIIAAGPYTLDDNLQFKPFAELVDVVVGKGPDVVILMGPFLDYKHPLIEAGEVDKFPHEYFKDIIVAGVDRMKASRPGMKVILIPSTRDMITDFTVFPQPPLGSGLTAQQTRARKRALGLNQQGDQTDGNILTFPNPVFFAMNEIVIGVSTQDILLHLGGKEVSKNLGGGSLSQASSSQPSSSQPTPTKPSSSTTTTAPVPENRIVRLFRHLVEQRSFYPMHPPGLSDTHIEYAQLYTSNNDTTTSTSNNDKNFEFKVTPDILIVPSALRFSAGIIHQKDGGSGCVCVNPGKLVIGSSGGTFVSMCIHLLDMEELEGKCRLDAADGGDVDEFYLQHSVGDRVRVDIVRI